MFFLILIILTTLFFTYTNGFHDAANAIATVVSTKALSPRSAAIYGAILNFSGAFVGIQVAKTIGVGLIASAGITQGVIFCALLSAIIWNIVTWYYGLPASSSHALIGGLLGAAIFRSGTGVVYYHEVFYKIIFPMVAYPFIGMILAFIVLSLFMRALYKMRPATVNFSFGRLQLLSSGLMAFSHGSNDAQKSMGIITLALMSFYGLKSFEIPFWVILSCALSMGLGTITGGWRIIHTMGKKIIRLKPLDGFVSEFSSATIILMASYFGFPVSTTHVVSGSIVGVGCRKRFSSVKWGVFRNVIFAWIITIPACVLISGLFYWLVKILV